MPEDKSKRVYGTTSTATGRLRLESIRPATQGRASSQPYARLTPQQRQALVLRLIDFFKNM